MITYKESVKFQVPGISSFIYSSVKGEAIHFKFSFSVEIVTLCIASLKHVTHQLN
jgi:hypothetical protein